jgi:uncharacterized protein YggE
MKSPARLYNAANDYHAANQAIGAHQLSQLFAIQLGEAVRIIESRRVYAKSPARRAGNAEELARAKAHAESTPIGWKRLASVFEITQDEAKRICADAVAMRGSKPDISKQARESARRFALANPDVPATVIAKQFKVCIRCVYDARAKYRPPAAEPNASPRMASPRKPRNVLYANLGGELVPCRRVRRWDSFECFVGAKEVR